MTVKRRGGTAPFCTTLAHVYQQTWSSVRHLVLLHGVLWSPHLPAKLRPHDTPARTCPRILLYSPAVVSNFPFSGAAGSGRWQNVSWLQEERMDTHRCPMHGDKYLSAQSTARVLICKMFGKLLVRCMLLPRRGPVSEHCLWTGPGPTAVRGFDAPVSAYSWPLPAFVNHCAWTHSILFQIPVWDIWDDLYW